MKPLKYAAIFFVLTAVAASSAAPTFGDLAVLLAKGYFGSYVKQDASLEQCVAFLNSKGVCFSLFDLMDVNKAVTQEDCARVVGQSMLLFSGEAEIINGCIKKPLEAETWVDYCLMNDIDFPPIWNRLVQCTADGSVPEVRTFFGK
jgi:hypothetical protein